MSQRYNWLVLALITLTLALGSAACGDDGDDGGAAANNSTNTNSGTTSTNNATTSTNAGTTSTNNSTTSTNNGSTGTTGTNNASTGTNNSTTSTNNGTTTEPEIDIENPEAYNYDAPATYINSIVVETDGSIGVDVDGDGSVDNALGALLTQLSSLLGDTDVNQILAESIADGTIAIGTSWYNMTEASVEDRNDLDVHFLLFEDTDDDPSTTDEFNVDLASFYEGTGTPLIRFKDSTLSGGTLNAGPSQFRLSLDLGGIAFDLLVDSALMTGDASTDGPGMAIANGELSGAVPLDSIVGALNNYLASDSCSCLGLDGDLISGSDATFACTGSFDASACQGTDQETCGTIANACSIAVPLVTGVADIDLSGDGTADSISVFLNLEGQGTVLLGPGSAE